jgi:metallophosphoesterase superfamily enzyme
MAETRPLRVVCLGDSFDDTAGCAELDASDADTLERLQEGRSWLWIEGNHDRAACPPGGTAALELFHAPLTFRHIARPDAKGELSGHFHPKARLSARGKGISRPCFLFDAARVILPAYGTYTGGLDWTAPALRRLFQGPSCAILTGTRAVVIPVPEPAAPATAR